MTDVVLREIEQGVALLTLNRPDRLNAWTNAMHREYFDLLDDCAARDDVRAIVVTGAGKGFCAGADMGDLQTLGSGDVDYAEHRPDPRPHFHARTIPKPVIAAVNGACAGLGLVHALMCDLRFAAADAKFTTAFARRGLVAEHGISWLLPRLVGPSRALDLLMSARVVLGEEAAAMGLVDRAVPRDEVVDVALAYARDLATNCSPTSMAIMKRQVWAALEQPSQEALDIANQEMLESFGRPDFTEGVESFVERRPPQFAPFTARASSQAVPGAPPQHA
jgi:enoyl-CoA hydratase/carnithine racemase